MLEPRDPMILLVDDSFAMLSNLQQILQPYCNVISFTDPTKALDYFKKNKLTDVSLIVCDEKMPQMKGVELMAEAYQISPDTGRMMLTGHQDFTVAQNALNRGKVHYFMTKPINPPIFIERALFFLEKDRLKQIHEDDEFYLKLKSDDIHQLEKLLLFYESNMDHTTFPGKKEHFQLLALFYKSYRRYRQGKAIHWNQYGDLLEQPFSSMPFVQLKVRLQMLQAADTLQHMVFANGQQESLPSISELQRLLKNALGLIESNHLHFCLFELMHSFPSLMQWCSEEGFLPEDFMLKFYTLGTLEIQKYHERFEYQKILNRKQVQLLTILLSQEEKKVPVDLILEYLWPERDLKSAMNLFYTNLYQLRKSLDPAQAKNPSASVLRYQDRLCWLDPSRVWVEDWVLNKKMKSVNSVTLKNCPADYLDQAVETLLTFRDQYLSDYPYDDWTESRRRKLLTQWNSLLQSCIDLLEKQQRYEVILNLLLRGTEIDPDSEPYYQNLMQKYETSKRNH